MAQEFGQRHWYVPILTGCDIAETRNPRSAARSSRLHSVCELRHAFASSALLASLCVAGCSGSGPDDVATMSGAPSSTTKDADTKASPSAEAGSGAPNMPSSTSTSASASASAAGNPASGTAGKSAEPNTMPNTTPAGKPNVANAGAPAPAANGGGGGGMSKPATPATLDPKVDWKALKLTYSPMYSAFDGVHKFQVPVHVEKTTIELSGWSAIPADAVQIDPDPEGGGVLLTVLKDTPEVTIAARTTGSTALGGTATLHVTKGTPEEWAVGQQRYTTGADWTIVDPASLPPELQGMDLSKLTLEDIYTILGPIRFTELLAQVPERIANSPPPPSNLKCTNCHSSGAKYFEVQHTPTQIAQISDADVATIFTKGMKPASVAFRVLPKDLQPRYVEMHHWMATDAEIKGLIVYLRSLTPKGQGDILGTDGKYQPAQPDKDLITIILEMLGKP